MADPLTLLGAIAASSQLIQQGYNIARFFLEAYSDIKMAPELVLNRLRQVGQVIGASRLIQQTPALQKDEVADVLTTCCVKAAAVQLKLTELLSGVGDKGWQQMKKSLAVFMQKKDLMALFDDLEREKSALILCLQAIQP